MAAERQFCSGCEAKLPEGIDVPPGWTVARLEDFGLKKVSCYYAYSCPSCTFAVVPKQPALFSEETELK